mmetsp:Transcript_57570/g.108495  ORF Transcript_57570/g.108495 Transcript_57570/m.108495 type:complete len:579 (-) Transcript_57570:88-1824(-)
MGCVGSSGGAPGECPVSPRLQEASNRAEQQCGKIALAGRYHSHHHHGKRLEDYYEIKKDVLGSGYNGNVYLASGKRQKGRFAVKGFKLKGLSEEKLQELETEVDIFLGVDHPNIVRLVDVFETKDMLYMVMECMEGGELFERLKVCKSFSEQDAAHLTFQMLLAVNYLHSQNIVHRDLKLQNFLFKSSGGSKQIKLIDFGFSRRCRAADDDELTSNVGTLLHAAPEVLKKSYTSQCDLWSLGTIVFLLLSGKEPFLGNVKEMMRSIVKGRYDMKGEEWSKVSDQGKDFVRSLLKVNPDERLTAEKALQHPWITQHRETDKTNKPRMNQATATQLIKFSQVSTFRRACMTMMALSLSPEDEAELYDAFLAADIRRNGILDINEFKHVIEEHFDLHDEEAQKIFDSIDSNNDQTIHYSDFLSACMLSRISMCDDLLEAAFRRLDKSETGTINVNDMKDIFGGAISDEELQKVIRAASPSGGDELSLECFFAYVRKGEDKASRRMSKSLIDREVKISPQKVFRRSRSPRSPTMSTASSQITWRSSPTVSLSLGDEHPSHLELGDEHPSAYPDAIKKDLETI